MNVLDEEPTHDMIRRVSKLLAQQLALPVLCLVARQGGLEARDYERHSMWNFCVWLLWEGAVVC